MPVLVNASDDRMMHDVPAMASDKDMDNTVLFIVVILALLSLRLFSSLLLSEAWRVSLMTSCHLLSSSLFAANSNSVKGDVLL